MIGYTTVGTNDIEKAAAFYDELLALLGAKRSWDMERFKLWGTAPDKPSFSIALPYDGNDASVGNGVMIALVAPDRETVDAIYAKAIELGATCEGEPGPRGGEDSPFYAGYFRDLDGNKLNAFHMQAS
ncbi:VOC family protein [Kordiimonas marina]|uniref:VOC family protein n=1 Tax=Kordiimonas marina TaxID=2872312 RepID=UPI001FF5A750|nr:VOC family protein [Kordiimonas marina]MCJ9429175.1 VOC family protein [Kordiimonas marina]